MKKLISILMILGFIFSSGISFADDVNPYRVKRQQLERIRRDILYQLGHNPEWMHSQDQVKKVMGVVIEMDIAIVQLYLEEQDERETQQQEKEYKSLRSVNMNENNSNQK